MIPTTKIFIGCLPGHTKEEEIHKHFSQYCQIIKLKINFRSNGVCAGYGHFTTKISDQEKEILIACKHVYNGRILDCRVYVKGPKLKGFLQDFTERKIYVKNIPKGTTDEEFSQFFSLICQVERAYIGNQVHDKDYLFGFVITGRKEEARKLIEGGQIKFKGCLLEFSKSVSKKLESMKKNEKLEKKKKFQIEIRKLL